MPGYALNNATEATGDDYEDEPLQKCRVCTISSDCFSYYNIFDKVIFKNVLIHDALRLITNLQVWQNVYHYHKHKS